METVPTIRRDVGVSGSTGTQERRGRHQLNGRLATGDTLVVAIDRIGRWPHILKVISVPRDRGVKIRPLAKAERERTRYPEAGPDTPGASFGQVLTRFAAWAADQELKSIRRRARDGLERARKVGLGELAPIRRIVGDFECSPSTVPKVLRRERVG